MPQRAEYYAILNPVANRGRASATGSLLEAAFRRAGRNVEIATSQHSGHGAELARAAADQGRPHVISIGGDGILHEVVNGLMRSSRGDSTALAVIPAGSGNDFSKMLDLPRDLDEAVHRILSNETRSVDIGRVDGWTRESGEPVPWFFVNGIGLGFDAQVGQQASRLRWLGGNAMYGVAVLRVLADLGAPRMRVLVDGIEIADQPLILTTISNGACHGGTFWMCPDAIIDDGQFEVLVADARSVRDVIRLIPRVMRGTHLDQVGVSVHRGARVTVTSEDPLPIHADGEIVGKGVRQIEMEVVRGGLRVLG